MPVIALAVARPKISATKGAYPLPPRRTSLRTHDVEQAINHARNLCFNFEDTASCKVAWDLVEELSAEMGRQREENLRIKDLAEELEDPLASREYDV
jgi:hypothetical protein